MPLLHLSQEGGVLLHLLGLSANLPSSAVHFETDVGLHLHRFNSLLYRVLHSQVVHELHHRDVLRLCALLGHLRCLYPVSIVHEHGCRLGVGPAQRLPREVKYLCEDFRETLLMTRTIRPTKQREPMPVELPRLGVLQPQVVGMLLPAPRVEEGVLQVPSKLPAVWFLLRQHVVQHVVAAFHRQSHLVDPRGCQIVDGAPLLLLRLPHPALRVHHVRPIMQGSLDHASLYQPAELSSALLAVLRETPVVPRLPPIGLRLVAEQNRLPTASHLLHPLCVFSIHEG